MHFVFNLVRICDHTYNEKEGLYWASVGFFDQCLLDRYICGASCINQKHKSDKAPNVYNSHKALYCTFYEEKDI